jgi:hypothetical protein
MDITTHSVNNPFGSPEIPGNSIVLKKDLKHALDHTNHLLSEALANPDHISHDFCHELSKNIIHLHNLAAHGAQVSDKSLNADSVKDNSQIILNIVTAPIYVP